MDNAVSGFIVLMALVVFATLGAMFATSTAVLYYQEDDQAGRYTCIYVTDTGRSCVRSDLPPDVGGQSL
jgi:hypothetical protein